MAASAPWLIPIAPMPPGVAQPLAVAALAGAVEPLAAVVVAAELALVAVAAQKVVAALRLELETVVPLEVAVVVVARMTAVEILAAVVVADAAAGPVLLRIIAANTVLRKKAPLVTLDLGAALETSATSVASASRAERMTMMRVSTSADRGRVAPVIARTDVNAETASLAMKMAAALPTEPTA